MGALALVLLGTGAAGETREVADLSLSNLWVIVPSLLFFVVLPLALRGGMTFWLALLFACFATGMGYLAWLWTARRIGMNL
jgi:predicted permease